MHIDSAFLRLKEVTRPYNQYWAIGMVGKRINSKIPLLLSFYYKYSVFVIVVPRPKVRPLLPLSMSPGSRDSIWLSSRQKRLACHRKQIWVKEIVIALVVVLTINNVVFRTWIWIYRNPQTFLCHRRPRRVWLFCFHFPHCWKDCQGERTSPPRLRWWQNPLRPRENVFARGR